MTLMIPNAGSAMYIPRLSAITDSPSPRTSDSEFAFSMIDNDESIGVNPTFTTSLNIGLSLSMSAITGENE